MAAVAERAASSAAAGRWGLTERAQLVAALGTLSWTSDKVTQALAQPSPDPWHQFVVQAGTACQASVFVLPRGAKIPLHDHPAMTVLCRMLSGRMLVHSYRWQDCDRGLATDEGVTELGPASPVLTLEPSPGELHEITALTDCAFFDLCAPYYDEDGGRPCRYYGVTARGDGKLVRLREPPSSDAGGSEKQAIMAVEARGAAVNLHEDAHLSVLQAGLLARRLIDGGYDVAIRMILDPGQSVEEYSVLCHAPLGLVERLRSSIATARNVSKARRAVVAAIRQRNLPVELAADAVDGVVADEGLFHAALVSRVVGVNDAVVDRIRAVRHELLDTSAMAGYEELLHRSVGRPYLDLEESVARAALRRCLDGREAEITTVSRPGAWPTGWLSDPTCARVVASDLAAKVSGRGRGDFHGRLIGLFTPVEVEGEEQPYFNAPTTCRYEHGKVRLIPRDRFGILALRGSERITFETLASLMRRQAAGTGSRPVALKYPYTARYLATSIGHEAITRAAGADVTVVFIEGVAGSINAGTGGLLDGELAAILAGTAVRYERLSAKAGARRALPAGPGGLPLIHDRLLGRIPRLFTEPSLLPRSHACSSR